MSRRATVLTVLAAFAGLAALGACAAPEPATPEQRRLAEQRLLLPFEQPVEVGCGELTIEMTGNFHPFVGQPGVDPSRHRVDRSESDEFLETTWTNPTGDPATPFVVTIGDPGEFTDAGFVPGVQTRFTVVRQVRLRVFRGRRELALNVTAEGEFVIVRDAGGEPKEIAHYSVVDGSMRQR
jgi:hypothetical protein